MHVVLDNCINFAIAFHLFLRKRTTAKKIFTITSQGQVIAGPFVDKEAVIYRRNVLYLGWGQRLAQIDDSVAASPHLT